MQFTSMDFFLNFIKQQLPDLVAFKDEQIAKGLQVETEHQDIAKGDIMIFAKIALAHLKEDPDYYDKLEVMEKTNAKSMPSIYYAKHIEPGICRYEEEDIYIGLDALKKMNASFAGKPIYIRHQEVEVDTIKEDADGYVSESFYNEIDGWMWLKLIAVTDEAKDVIFQGWRNSNAYVPTQWGGPSDYHNIPYGREVLDGEYTHLALVDNPRYENTCIMTPTEFKEYNDNKRSELANMLNSKDKKNNGGHKIMLFKWKKGSPAENDEVLNAVTTIDGEDVSVKQMIDFMSESKKNAKGDDDDDKMMENEVEVDGEKMKVKDLVNAYKEMKGKKNADDEAEAKAKKEKEEEENKKNADEEEKKKKKEKEKKNALKATEIENAKKAMELLELAKKGDEDKEPELNHEMTNEKVKRGKENY